MPKTILIAGGAGFVGSSIAVALREANTERNVIAFDNLRRRGSELNVQRLRRAGAQFVHGDIRVPEDLAAAGDADCVIECGGEASVWAGYNESPHHVLQSNLSGAMNCLEYARIRNASIVFLSTSRVYPLAALQSLNLLESETRFDLSPQQAHPGISQHGISEDFPLAGVRSIYGATKLAAELLLQEYAAAYGVRSVIYRCGLIAGPWQMGKVDQGVVTLWVARHVFGGALAYLGYGGSGRQVRDVLHVADLARLIALQLANPDAMDGGVYNVGGGLANSLSLRELTAFCEKFTGRVLDVRRDSETRAADIPYYVSDARRVTNALGWRPERSVEQTIGDIHRWIFDNADAVRGVLDA